MPKTDVRRPLALPAALRGLDELALNLWWSWDAEATAFWRDLAERAGAPARLRSPLSPVGILGALSAKKLAVLAADTELTARLRGLRRRLRDELASARGAAVDPATGITAQRPVAYFSMEFGLATCLPIYAGGLGILAGDHLKSASDIALPLVGVGLIYRNGYFRQRLDKSGHQRVVYPSADYTELPIELVRDRKGKELRVTVALPARGRRRRDVKLRAWRVRVGRATIYLLDTDFAANPAADRALTQRLYGGTREDRIQQEVLLGLGGVRLLRALGLDPAVWHLNEGHVAFTALERIRELVLGASGALDFRAAVEAVASNTVFTTHTPVPEGNEVFDLALARRFLAPHCDSDALPVDELLGLGIDHAHGERPVLSMTVLALRLSRFRNGVSALHGIVSRGMWRHIWPHYGEDEVPIGSVTNGVHVPTWIAPEADALFAERVAPDWRRRIDDFDMWQAARKIPDAALWIVRNALRAQCIDFVRERVRLQMLANGSSEAAARRATKDLLDPNAFTIGFARRFALYKRADLIFRHLERAVALFSRKRQPVQIIFAGKPHPEDPAGKKLFERVATLSRRRGLRGKVVLLENYDMDVGAALVRGVDLWLNNPVRPQEASGTSGQKVPFNLGLNASILDGWWFEGFDEGVGWAIGAAADDQSDVEDDREPKRRDDEDAADLLRVLSREVVPLFYERNARGVPTRWLRMVKQSMAALIPRFSSQHMLRRYVDELYVPAARNGRVVSGHRHAAARDLPRWRDRVARSWPLVHFRDIACERGRRGAKVVADVFLAGLEPGDVLFEAWWGDEWPGVEATVAASSVREPDGTVARVSFTLPPEPFESLSVRVRPYHAAHPDAAELGVALEALVELTGD